MLKSLMAKVFPGLFGDQSPEAAAKTNPAQKREAYRVPLNRDSGIKLYIETDRRLLSTVTDLSPAGIGFTVPGDITPWLQDHRRINHGILELPGGASFVCSVELKSWHLRADPHLCTQVGGMLDALPTSQQKKLDKLLLAIQRKQRRSQK